MFCTVRIVVQRTRGYDAAERSKCGIRSRTALRRPRPLVPFVPPWCTAVAGMEEFAACAHQGFEAPRGAGQLRIPAGGLLISPRVDHFGGVRFDATLPDPQVVFRLIRDPGEVLYEQELARGQRTPPSLR